MRIIVLNETGKSFRVSRQVEVAGSSIFGEERVGTIERGHLTPRFEFKPTDDQSLNAAELAHIAGIVDGINVAYDHFEAVIEKLEKMKEVLAA